MSDRNEMIELLERALKVMEEQERVIRRAIGALEAAGEMMMRLARR